MALVEVPCVNLQGAHPAFPGFGAPVCQGSHFFQTHPVWFPKSQHGPMGVDGPPLFGACQKSKRNPREQKTHEKNWDRFSAVPLCLFLGEGSPTEIDKAGKNLVPTYSKLSTGGPSIKHHTSFGSLIPRPSPLPSCFPGGLQRAVRLQMEMEQLKTRPEKDPMASRLGLDSKLKTSLCFCFFHLAVGQNE